MCVLAYLNALRSQEKKIEDGRGGWLTGLIARPIGLIYRIYRSGVDVDKLNDAGCTHLKINISTEAAVFTLENAATHESAIQSLVYLDSTKHQGDETSHQTSLLVVYGSVAGAGVRIACEWVQQKDIVGDIAAVIECPFR